MNETKLTVKDSALSFLINFILCQLSVIVITIISFVIYQLCGLDTSNFSLFLNTGLGYLITAVSLYLTMFLVFIYFNKHKNNKITKKVKIKKLFFYIFIATLSFITLYPIITCFDSLLSKLEIKINTLPYNLSTKNYFISLISLVIAPAICEELIFRGLIFQGLKKYGKSFSIIISALMFSVYHMAISQAIYPLLIGLLLGVIMYYEGNIYYCIALHMTNNFLSLTLSYFNINLLFNHWTYILLAIILFVVYLSVVLFFILKKIKTPNKQKFSTNEKIYLFSSLGIMILFWILLNIP